LSDKSTLVAFFDTLHDAAGAIVAMDASAALSLLEIMDRVTLSAVEDMVMGLQVADADACWAHLQSLNLSVRFPNVRLGAPHSDAASTLRRGHFLDPSGVLWHFSQSLA
jgi:hypothetical protein